MRARPMAPMPSTQNAPGTNPPTRLAATAAMTTAEISGAVTPSDCAMRPGNPTALRRRPRPSPCADASINPSCDDLRPCSRCEITSHMAGVVSSLRGRLTDARATGTFVKLPALESVDICAASLDFCVVDYEHSQLSEADVLRLVRHAGTIGFPAV